MIGIPGISRPRLLRLSQVITAGKQFLRYPIDMGPREGDETAVICACLIANMTAVEGGMERQGAFEIACLATSWRYGVRSLPR